MATSTPTTKRSLFAPKSDTDGPAAHSGIRFRPDVEGLRALAIALVVLDHLKVPGFRGGFIGVDIFFVISGFLITSLLATEHYRNETTRNGAIAISIKAFYMRRARRILPASLAVIAFTLIASKLIFNAIRFPEVQADALWATFFAENLHLMAQATDYFAQGTAVSPLQNYWSLAVEEQFYFIWPVLFIAATLANRTRIKQLTSRFMNTPDFSEISTAGRWDLRVRWAVIALFVASLTWSIIATANNAAPAYYSPFTRAYELALGAGVALTINTLVGVGETLSKALGGIAMALVIAAMFVINPDTAFPGAWALLPTTAAALLIIAGMNPAANTPTGWLLSTPPLRFIGRISYSLYLWHWPIIVFAGALVSERTFGGAPRTITLIAVSVLVSWASYHLIEQPFRRFKLSDKLSVRGIGFERRFFSRTRKWTGTTQDALKLTLMGGATAAVLLTLAAFARPLPTIFETPVGGGDKLAQWANWDGNGPSPDGATASTDADTFKTKAWTRALRQALTHKTATAEELRLIPGIAKLGPNVECYTIESKLDAAKCVRAGTGLDTMQIAQNKNATVALIGNSYASQWLDSLAAVLPQGSSIHPLTNSGCPVTTAAIGRKNRFGQDCGVHYRFMLKSLRELKPDLIVVSRLAGDGDTPPLTATLLKSLKQTTPHVLLIGPPTQSFKAAECLNNGPDLRDCNKGRPYTLLFDSQDQATAQVTGVTYLSTSKLFCLGANCPFFIDGKPVRFDGSHLTATAMVGVRGFLRDAVAKAIGASTTG